MSNELCEIYGTVKDCKGSIIININIVEISGNLTTRGHIQLLNTNHEMASADPSGILTRIDNLDNSLNSLLTSNNDASFRHLSISGNIIPTSDNEYTLGDLNNSWKDVFIGPGSLYVNGKKVIEDVSDELKVTTTTNQNLTLMTSGTGNLKIQSDNNIELITTSGQNDIEITSANDLQLSSTNNLQLSGTNGIQMQSNIILSTGKEISNSADNYVYINDGLKISGAIYDTNNNKGTNGQVLQSTGTNWNWATPITITDISNAIANLVDSAPDALNTLNELAAALADDASFSTTITSTLATKLNIANSRNISTVTPGTVTASSALVVDANKEISGFGKIGIGTTSPSEKLVVEDGSILIGNNSQYPNGGNSFSDNFSGHKLKFDSTYNGWKIVMYNSNNWSSGFGVSSGFTTYYSGGHHVFYTGTTNTNNESGRETLRIVNNDHRPLRIQTTPLNKNCIITQDSNRTGAHAWIGGLDGKWNGTSVASMFIMSGSDTTNKNNGYIKFHTINNGGDVYNNNTERLRITADGNVGIGTTNPSEKLDVNGNISANTFYGDGSNLTGITTLSGLTYPTSDGTADQVLKTDGSGNLSWTNMQAPVQSAFVYFSQGGYPGIQGSHSAHGGNTSRRFDGPFTPRSTIPRNGSNTAAIMQKNIRGVYVKSNDPTGQRRELLYLQYEGSHDNAYMIEVDGLYTIMFQVNISTHAEMRRLRLQSVIYRFDNLQTDANGIQVTGTNYLTTQFSSHISHTALPDVTTGNSWTNDNAIVYALFELKVGDVVTFEIERAEDFIPDRIDLAGYIVKVDNTI